MPIIYLSPSTQEWNPYVTGGTEEFYMNEIADAMIPYLRSSGIRYVRNTPDMTAASSIRQSNNGNYDLHLALHSNASPESIAGQRRGIEAYYAPRSVRGKRAADIFVQNFKAIYPLPDKVRALTTTTLGEVTKTRAPAVLLEIGYHDNVDDANWITSNIELIARDIVLSLTEYFGIPFVMPMEEQTGVVKLTFGRLNIRSRPNLYSPILAQAYNGQTLTVLGAWENWYVVDFNGTIGYASADYITLLDT